MKDKTIAITDGKILQGEEFVSGKNLFIRNGRIFKISSEKSSRAFKMIKASGLQIVPGFIDLHLHCDVLEERGDPIERLQEISLSHARFGTTRFLATLCTNSLSRFRIYAQAIKQSQKILQGAQVLGAHLEGPFLNPSRAGAQSLSFIQKPNLKMAREIFSIFGKTLSLMTLAPELKGIDPIIQFLKAKGVRLSMGHTDATYQEALHGASLGVSYATHIFNQMRGLHHRELGATGAVLLDSRFFAEVITDGFHLNPMMVKMITQVKDLEKIVLATDCFTKISKDDGRDPPRIGDGNLMGSALSLRRALINLVEFCALSWGEALKTASLNPARALGIDQDFGSLESGKWADLVLMDEKRNVQLTMVGGKIVYRG